MLGDSRIVFFEKMSGSLEILDEFKKALLTPSMCGWALTRTGGVMWKNSFQGKHIFYRSWDDGRPLAWSPAFSLAPTVKISS